jgi:hypothetical protein
MKKYLFLSLFFIVGSIYIVIQLYKNKDFKIIDAIVESTADVLGIESATVKEKKEKREEVRMESERISEKKQDDSLLELMNISRVVKEEPEIIPAEFNTIVNEDMPKKKEATASLPVEEVAKDVGSKAVEDDDPFNTVGGDSFSGPAITKPGQRVNFSAIVHNALEVVNDGKISLRLAEAITIKGRTYPKNYVFEAKTNLFEGKITIIGKLNEKDVKNYDGAQEGYAVREHNKGRRGEVIMSEGEKITLGYYK